MVSADELLFIKNSRACAGLDPVFESYQYRKDKVAEWLMQQTANLFFMSSNLILVSMIGSASNLFEYCDNPFCDLMRKHSNLILVSKKLWKY